jgi:hypothetical protein
MPLTKKIYNIDNRQTLVDLNGDSINFKLDFRVSSKDNNEFEMLVVTQATLDSGKPIEYKKVQGSMSGNMLSDKNVYQNYYLILRAQQSTEVTVELNFEKLPDVIPKNEQFSPPHNHPPESFKPPLPQQQQPLVKKKGNSLLIKIFIGVAIIGVIAAAYYLFFYKRKQTDDNGLVTKNNPVPNASPKASPKASPVVPAASPSPDLARRTPTDYFGTTPRNNSDLISRLKGLPIK